jgi:hypothetical protein
VAGSRKTGWRVEERTKKLDPANNNPSRPKPKPKGNDEVVKVGGGDEHLGRARIGEKPVPVLHGHVR